MNRKNLKTQENSNEKLRDWEALAPYASASGVEKSLL